MGTSPHPGPVVLYSTYVNTLQMEFFVFAGLLIVGRRGEEEIMRQAALVAMCVVILADVAWTNLHPRPVSRRVAAAAAAGAASAFALNLAVAFGLAGGLEYSAGLARSLLVAAGLCWIPASQIGTDFVVRGGRSPARFLILAWITVVASGSSLSLVPNLREMPRCLVLLACAPRLASVACLALAGASSDDDGSPSGEAAAGAVHSVGLPRASQFSAFALTSVYGEAFNDIATDLVVRRGLSAGDSTLQLAYNGSVLMSMCCGYLVETAAAGGANRAFAALWGLCQLARSLGISHLTSENWPLMAGFVFIDKLTGPLGSAAMDAALLALIRPDGGVEAPRSGRSGYRISANGLWTCRYPAEQLQRTLCQMLLLRMGSGMPWWVSIAFTSVSVAFVFHTLRPSRVKEKKMA